MTHQLPPRQSLPPEIRDRMRATLLDEMRSPQRTHRIRPPLAVAAAVAVLALGVTVLDQSPAGPNTTSSGPITKPADGTPPPLDRAMARANLDRCWAAAHKIAAVPARSAWQPVFAVTSDGLTVTAVRADGKPLICETTRTTVTVSNPDATLTYAAGTKTAALLTSVDGAVGGVMDPSWSAMENVAVGRYGASNGGPGFFADGMFVDFGGFAPGGRYTVRQTRPGSAHPELDLPAAPPALVAAVDRPDPPADRTSAAGRFLGECIANADDAVPDPASWQPVVLEGTAPNRFVMARSGDQLATCSSGSLYRTPGDTTIDYRFLRGSRPLLPDEPIQYSYGTSYPTDPSGDHQTVIFLGLLRPDVASVEIIAPNGTPRSISIVDGTFSTEFAGASLKDMLRFTLVLRDRSGGQLYRGSIETDY